MMAAYLPQRIPTFFVFYFERELRFRCQTSPEGNEKENHNLNKQREKPRSNDAKSNIIFPAVQSDPPPPLSRRSRRSSTIKRLAPPPPPQTKPENRMSTLPAYLPTSLPTAVGGDLFCFVNERKAAQFVSLANLSSLTTTMHPFLSPSIP